MTTLRLPLTVIGGYLGAGKTTLLNHLLKHSEGRRYAVLVNDFGSLNIDAALLDGPVLRLDNGCVCCSLAGGLATALHAVLEHEPEHVLVEASGVADPTRLAGYGYTAPYTPGGVVVVADAETVRERSRDRFVGDSVLRQLRGADLLVLNKVDLVGPGELEGLLAWLAEVAPGAAVLPARHGRIPADLLPGAPEARAPKARSQQSARVLPEGTHPDYASWSFRSEAPLREEALRELLAGWPDTVLRAKGIVHLAGDPGRRHVFQKTGRRWSLVPDRPWSGDTPITEIVLIGLAGHLEGEPLVRALESTTLRSMEVP